MTLVSHYLKTWVSKRTYRLKRKNTISDRIKKSIRRQKDGTVIYQAKSFIIEVTEKSNLAFEEVLFQVEAMLGIKKFSFIEEIVIVIDGKIVKRIKRKR